jgi:ATP phosphoribosyltransferase regulatory subunit HisZ
VLRSDITPQIARVAATLLHDYPKAAAVLLQQ